jgi:hypothetical protein
MIKKIKVFWELLHRGREIANADDWINHGITANKVSLFILSLAAALKVLGIDLPVDNDTALLIGGGVIGVGNIVLGTITTHKAGLSSPTDQARRPVDAADIGTGDPIVKLVVPTTEPVPPVTEAPRRDNPFDDPYKY